MSFGFFFFRFWWFIFGVWCFPSWKINRRRFNRLTNNIFSNFTLYMTKIFYFLSGWWYTLMLLFFSCSTFRCLRLFLLWRRRYIFLIILRIATMCYKVLQSIICNFSCLQCFSHKFLHSKIFTLWALYNRLLNSQFLLHEFVFIPIFIKFGAFTWYTCWIFDIVSRLIILLLLIIYLVVTFC